MCLKIIKVCKKYIIYTGQYLRSGFPYTLHVDEAKNLGLAVPNTWALARGGGGRRDSGAGSEK
jgi:hypothetical protein